MGNSVYRYFFIVLYLVIAFKANAQVKVSYDTDDTLKGVILHEDPRLAVIFKKQKSIQYGVIYSGHGYRVQIYNGNDRNKANLVKVDFIRRFPGVPTYMTYRSPQFRIKVGDYRTHQEAERMYRLVSDIYHPSMIVPDIVVINTLQNDQ